MKIVSRRSENLTLLLRIFTALTIVCGFLTTAVPAFAANTEQVLFSFTGGTDGGYPTAPLIFDGDGNLYGTTTQGGANGYGAVFELSPANGGGWTESVLHSFNDNGTEGHGPRGGLVFDTLGNLYGTTQDGGSGTACSGGCGTVFELSPAGGGVWTETILYNFQGGSDGYYPQAGVILDLQGNLYGTTLGGGAADRGTVFELASGTRTETILHSFHVSTKDGSGPNAALAFDANGSLYGTTGHGGAGGVCTGGGGCGTVFKLTPNGQGGWTEKVLHSFARKGLSHPSCALVFDGSGNLYGTTAESWNGYGAVFELTASTKGAWKETVLHQFSTFKGGGAPVVGLVFDSRGNLFATADQGGAGCADEGCGVVFKLTPSKGKWAETTLLRFNDEDGAAPEASLILDTSGNLYGTTFFGGSGSCDNGGITGCGTVFEITP